MGGLSIAKDDTTTKFYIYDASLNDALKKVSLH